MCNKGIESLSQSETRFDHQHPHHQAVHTMDSPSATSNFSPGSNPGSNDDNPRVKFLCSFSGSIMPRPQDGKLRYVGGETRIVSVYRDITYEELMSKMRELYEGAAVLKYQQPDEDLDALVSVVNDDDVINMMEEYDKLGSGDGFTRLRVFLFSHPEHDSSSPFIDGDERDHERRYVDALNSLNDISDLRKQLQPDSPVIGHGDEIHGTDQFLNPLSLDGSSLHNQRICEPIPHYNLHHLAIPHMGSGQHQSVTQRYNEMEAPWSPAYYSPRHHGQHDSRPVGEYPSSPSVRYRMPFADLPPEEYARQQINPQPTYEHQHQYNENVVYVQGGTIANDKSGFPGNIFQGHNIMDGNSVCEQCRMTFHRNQPNLEHISMGSGQPQECPSNMEGLILNMDAKLHHGIFPSEQNIDHRSVYNEIQNHERGWILQHQLNVRADETRAHMSGAGRLNDHYIVDGSGLNIPIGQANLPDSHHTSPNLRHRGGTELGNEVFHDQAVPVVPHIHIPSSEERGVRYGVLPYAYGGENHHPPASHGHVPGSALWRNIQNPVHITPSYEASNSHQQMNGTVNPGYLRGTPEGSPRFCIGVDNQNPWPDSSQKMFGFEGSNIAEYSHGHVLRMSTNTFGQENPDDVRSPTNKSNFNTSLKPVQRSDSSSILVHDNLVSTVSPGQNLPSGIDMNTPEAMRLGGRNFRVEDETSNVEKIESLSSLSVSNPEQYKFSENNSEGATSKLSDSNGLVPRVENGNVWKPVEEDISAPEESGISVNRLSFLPELIASVKRAALVEAEEVKSTVEENASVKSNAVVKEETANESELVNAQGEPELESDDHLKTSKIEPTKAEAEAIARGLQTIKNDDLEEIRELGSGTYGAVFHGKWKGSDVAIKRIKASCFAGRPSERERLIADFWKEALILSSLHHPNVVSFYGIVRDGPDGSLATVTEFMVNGSLKQFLQKKDRTIDRRKRLIIAMDAAFGMEYLHGKNIVHFDLKCENLLVNMRDPQRPVCKIGDLGLSKVRQHTLVSGGVRGTLPWMAPELLSGKSNMVTEKIDVYSFGIVMWEVLTGDEPYADMHCASIIGGIVNNTLRPQIPSWCDPEWKALMESCWDSDPSKRPSFSEISQKLRNMAATMNVK